MYIILGGHGCGSEIIDAVLDSRDYDLYPYDLFLVAFNERYNLMLIQDNLDYNTTYLEQVNELSQIYKSARAYMPIFRFEKLHQERIHKYIYVDYSSNDAYEWVKNRAEALQIAFTLSQKDVINDTFVHKFRADLVVKLEDIMEGKLVNILKDFATDCELDSSMYEAWLELVKMNFPFPVNN